MMNQVGKILIVDDNQELLLALKLMLSPHFKLVETENNPERIPKLIEKDYDLILLDMNFRASVSSGNEGLYWLKKIKDINSSVSVIFISAYGDIELAVKSMREGAIDFIQKSWDEKKMLSAVLAAYKLHLSKQEITKLKKKQKHLSNVLESGFALCVGRSKAMKKILQIIDRVSPTEANILLLGENGTGKELIAREIHKKSKRAEEIFVKIDLGTIHENLFESELFGHKKGAFTDAKSSKSGRFEIASGGTLFLDEIGNLSLPLQAKLLSAIQNREIMPMGGNAIVPIDIRLICATNESLYDMVEQGTFREDLLYRINTIQVDLPPLREREEDITVLAEFFLEKYTSKYQKQQLSFSKLAIEKMKKHNWQGNVRELEHSIEKAVILTNDITLKSSDFDFGPNRGSAKKDRPSFKISDNEQILIKEALDQYEWNLSRTSQALGINRSTLYEKIKKYEL